jgi:hypothetical protein
MILLQTLTGVIYSAGNLFYRMAPYLLFGYVFAGLLHIFFNTSFVSRHLGKGDFLSVLKSSFFGIPLPLCSCSVIPAATSLKKEGTSRGAVLSFLITTPTTGVDSIFATYSLLGGFFTLYRIFASFITGVLAGGMANILLHGETDMSGEKTECKLCSGEEHHTHSRSEKLAGAARYAFVELIRDSGFSIVIGILIGGIIAYFMPADLVKTYLGSGITAMLVMLIAGIPMYVCATASIPIAAALLTKGMDPGAALVFLIAGPATNIVTMSVVLRDLGAGGLSLYLGSIVVSSLALGSLMNYTVSFLPEGALIKAASAGENIMPVPVALASALILGAVIMWNILYLRVRPFLRGESDEASDKGH